MTTPLTTAIDKARRMSALWDRAAQAALSGNSAEFNAAMAEFWRVKESAA
jgi:hypothetical protein